METIASEGGGGNDTLIGGAGNDTLDGGPGADTLLGGADNDTYLVNSLNDVVIEAEDEGIDMVRSSVSWTLTDYVENLTLIGNSAINGTGNASNNSLMGNRKNNVLSGEGGDDLLNGSGGSDTLLGGAGNDTLLGGAGNDFLDGGTDADVMLGGNGNDTYVVDSPNDTITENRNGGTDTVLSSISWSLGNHLEKLTLTGSAAINGTGNGLRNTIIGNNASNILMGGDNVDTLSGEGGADTLIGGEGNDILYLGLNDGAVDQIIYYLGDGSDSVNHFEQGVSGDLMQFNDIAFIDVVTASGSTQFRLGDGIADNSGFGKGALLLTLNGATGFTEANIGENILAGTLPTTFNFS